MKLIQTVLEKNFTVIHQGKEYYVNYLNSDGQTLGLCNRDIWQVACEDGEELNIYEFKGMPKKEKIEIKKNVILFDKLVSFCVKHFDDYKPEI